MKIRLLILALFLALFMFGMSEKASAQSPVGRSTGNYNVQDWERFYHYPYLYYPQNFRPVENYRSAESLYYRYPKFMQVPAYNPDWQNYYPVPRRFHQGHHFVLDIM